VSTVLAADCATENTLPSIAQKCPSAISSLQFRREVFVTDRWLTSLPEFKHSLRRLELRGMLLLTDNCLPFIACASQLVYLDLSYCSGLSSDGCQFLSHLSNLQTLKLNGILRLDEEAMKSVSMLTSLECLELSGCCNLDDSAVFHLSSLHNCRSLNVAHCFQLTDTSLCTALKAMNHLEIINVSYTKATDLLGTVLTLRSDKSQALQELYLSGTALKDESTGWIQKLTELKVLHVSRCSVGDAFLRHIENLQQLVDLDMSYTLVSERGLVQYFGENDRLQRLNLENCSLVSDFAVEAGIAKLSQLQHLDLSETSVSSSGMTAIGKLHKLKCLNLTRTMVASHGLEHLWALKSLIRLELDCSGITDGCLGVLSELENLEHLDLFSSRISDKGLSPLTKLSKLKSLEICSGLLTNSGMFTLSFLSSTLEELNVAHNGRISSSGVAHLSALSRLQNLNLGFTGITDNIVNVMKTLPSVHVLSISGCRFLSAKSRQILMESAQFRVVKSEIKTPEIEPPSVQSPLLQPLSPSPSVDLSTASNLTQSTHMYSSTNSSACTPG